MAPSHRTGDTNLGPTTPNVGEDGLVARVSRVKAFATRCADPQCRVKLIVPGAGRSPAFMVVVNLYRGATWVETLAWHDTCYQPSGAADRYGPVGRDVRAELAQRRSAAAKRAADGRL